MKELDRLWSAVVRERDGARCTLPRCSGTPTAPHHIFSRRHLATRWNTDNGILICNGCHMRGHFQDPEELRDRIIESIGEARFYKIKELARMNVKVGMDDLREIKERLEKEMRFLLWKKEER